MKYKMKSGGNKKPSKKMQMGGSFIEPNKELKFGGPMKYRNGGEDEELKAASKEIYQSMSWSDAKELGKTKEWLAANPEKAKKIKEESNKAFAADADARAAQRAADKRRGPSRQEKQNTPQGTSQNNKAKGKAPASKPATTPAKKPATSTPPKAAPQSMNRVQAKSVPMKTSAQIQASKPKPASATKVMLSGMSKAGTTKGKGEAEARFAGATKATKSATGASGSNQMKSKPASVSKRADRINKRANRIESKKNKKAAISEAKARLKAARRLESGGLKTPSEDQKGLKKLPTAVRNKMGYKKSGGKY